MTLPGASLQWAGYVTSPRAHPFAQGLPGCRVSLTALLVPCCLCPSAGQQFCVSPQSLQCREWPRGDTGRLRSSAKHLHPIPRAASVAWPRRDPREQQPPAAPLLASLGAKHSPQLCAPLSPRLPLLRLVRVTAQVVPPACPQEHQALLGLQQCLLWESCGSSGSSPRPPSTAALPFQSMAGVLQRREPRGQWKMGL